VTHSVISDNAVSICCQFVMIMLQRSERKLKGFLLIMRQSVKWWHKMTEICASLSGALLEVHYNTAVHCRVWSLAVYRDVVLTTTLNWVARSAVNVAQWQQQVAELLTTVDRIAVIMYTDASDSSGTLRSLDWVMMTSLIVRSQLAASLIRWLFWAVRS